MKEKSKSRFVLSIISAISGAVAAWMVLGTYPRWLSFSRLSQVALVFGVFILLGAVFYVLHTLNFKFLKNIRHNRPAKAVTAGLLLVLAAGAILLRYEIPFAFSIPFKVHQFQVLWQTDAEQPVNNFVSGEYEVSNTYYKKLLFPVFYEKTTSIQQDGKILDNVNYSFFLNRFTSKLHVRCNDCKDFTKISIISNTDQLPISFHTDSANKSSYTITLLENRKIYYSFFAFDLGFTIICIASFFGLFYFVGRPIIKSVIRVETFLLGFLVKLISSSFHWSRFMWMLLFLFPLVGISLFAEKSINSLLWSVSTFFVLLATLLFTAVLKVKNWIVFVIAFSILSFSNVLLVTQVTGLLGLLNHSWSLPGLHLLILITAYYLYRNAGKPPLTPAVKKFTQKEFLDKLIVFNQNNPEIIWLLHATILCYLFVVFLIIKVPSNIDDILTTYLPRAGYWLQQGSFKIWPTSTYNLPQIVYPLNGQLPLAWMIRLWGNDSLVGFLQYLSIPMGVAGIYGLSRLIGASRSQGLFAVLLFLGLPVIVILSSTALTDLLVANFIVALIFLVLKGIKERNTLFILISSLILGISLGVKQTVFFIVPGLLLLAIVLMISEGKKTLKPLFLWAGASIIVFLVFSSFIYFRNSITFDSILGPSELTQNFTHTKNQSGFSGMLSMGVTNSIKLLISAVFDNLPEPVYRFLSAILDGVFQNLQSWRGFQPENTYSRSVAWVGQVGFILIVITFFYSLLYSIKNKKWLIFGLDLAAITYISILIFIRQFTIASSRYMVSAVILLIPLTYLVIRKKAIRVILVVNSIIMMLVTLIFDGAKPLVGKNAIWQISENKARSLQFGSSYSSFEAIDEFLPEDSTIGILFANKFPQSYLFGSNYSRNVISLDPRYNVVTLPQLESQNIEFLLVNEKYKNQSNLSLPDLTWITDVEGLNFSIYEVPDSE